MTSRLRQLKTGCTNKEAADCSAEISFGLGDCFVTVELCSPWMVNWFEERFGFGTGERERSVGRYSIRQIGSECLALEGPDGLWMQGGRIQELAEPFVQHFLEKLAASCSLGLAFHAAGVSRDGKGLILSGSSGSGKSTLTCACLRRAFDYLSDEVICVSFSPFQVCGFPRPVNLKAGSSFVVRDWVSPAARVDRLWKQVVWIDPRSLGTGKIVKEAAPEVVVFPQFVSGSERRARLLSRAESLVRLMGLYVNRAVLPDSGFRMAARMARQLPCWQLQYSNALEAAGWLEDLLGSPLRPATPKYPDGTPR